MSFSPSCGLSLLSLPHNLLLASPPPLPTPHFAPINYISPTFSHLPSPRAAETRGGQMCQLILFFPSRQLTYSRTAPGESQTDRGRDLVASRSEVQQWRACYLSWFLSGHLMNPAAAFGSWRCSWIKGGEPTHRGGNEQNVLTQTSNGSFLVPSKSRDECSCVLHV